MPDQPEEWEVVANARLTDAQCMSQKCPQSIAGPYLAGYAIECHLKAYLQRKGIPFPTRGSGGHNLRQLWLASRLQLRDLGDDSHGNKTFYLDNWDTSLRYTTKLNDSSLDTQNLIEGAIQIAKRIQTQGKRCQRHQNKRR